MQNCHAVPRPEIIQIMTFSIAGRCESTGMFGLAVSSSSPAVAARCAFARAGVGAVSSQNITDPDLGTQCLDLMATGSTAVEAIDIIAKRTNNIEYRQLTAVDINGLSASFIGDKSLGIFSQASTSNVVCAGNLLSNSDIPNAMVEVFVKSTGHLAERLLLAMNAAVDAGGEAGPVHSAGMLLVDKQSWPIVDLRVDWHESANPIGELEKLWALYAPQLNDYVTRAKNPAAAPSYGVPGDDK